MPKVSVIVPVYNSGKYLQRSFDCLLNQTLKDIEIICINDGSTDNSLEVLKDFSERDKRIKIINLPENKGAGNAKNKGLEIASGEFTGFIDPDDSIDLNFFEELYNTAIKTNADIVKGELCIIRQDGTKTKRIFNKDLEKSIYDFKVDYTSAIYKSSLISDNGITFPNELIVGEDIVFLNKCTLKSKKLKLINNVNYYYIRRGHSLNTERYDEKRMKSTIKTYEYIVRDYNMALGKDISKEAYIQQYCANIISLLGFAIEQTDEKQLKLLCIQKAIELFKNCPLYFEFENYFKEKYEPIFGYIKNEEAEKLSDIAFEYKNILNYCVLKRLRQNVKRDIIK